MVRIVTFDQEYWNTNSLRLECPLYWLYCGSMYDLDGNGWIDLGEMTKLLKSIYAMMGPGEFKAVEFVLVILTVVVRSR